MSKSPEARSSAIQFDGALPCVAHSDELTLHTAQANQQPFVAPCDLTIVKAVCRLTEAPGTAAAKILLGTKADNNAYGEHSFATTDATGLYDITADLVGTAIAEGAELVFGTDGAATTTGLVMTTVVMMPTSSQ